MRRAEKDIVKYIRRLSLKIRYREIC